MNNRRNSRTGQSRRSSSRDRSAHFFFQDPSDSDEQMEEEIPRVYDSSRHVDEMPTIKKTDEAALNRLLEEQMNEREPVSPQAFRRVSSNHPSGKEIQDLMRTTATRINKDEGLTSFVPRVTSGLGLATQDPISENSEDEEFFQDLTQKTGQSSILQSIFKQHQGELEKEPTPKPASKRDQLRQLLPSQKQADRSRRSSLLAARRPLPQPSHRGGYTFDIIERPNEEDSSRRYPFRVTRGPPLEYWHGEHYTYKFGGTVLVREHRRQ